MSLVIAAWDGFVGLAVSEGRAVLKGANRVIPIMEDCHKIRLLQDGSILGITGDMLVTVCLRAAIENIRLGFRGLCAVMPDLMAEYRHKYPDAEFGVVLLGEDGGRIHGASWSTKDTSPAQQFDSGCIVLGLTSEAHRDAAKAVSAHFQSAGPRIDARTCGALTRIVEDLATRHNELNNNVISLVVVPGGQESMSLKPLGFTPEVLAQAGADQTALNTARDVATGPGKAVAESGANATAGHVLTQSVQPSADLSAYFSSSPTGGQILSGTWTPIPGLGWTVSAQSPSDVYNIAAALLIVAASGPGDTNSLEVAVIVDGATGSPHNVIVLPYINPRGFVPFVGTLTGLTAGSHTIQLYVTSTLGGCNAAVFQAGTYATCQRIF